MSVENLLTAWEEFIKGKRGKRDVQKFSLDLVDNTFLLNQDLANHTYQHGPYQAFRINDPKPRQIHKSCVRDRLLHRAVYRILYPFFDRTFISDSFSCRLNKGTHRAINRFRSFCNIVSRNNHRTCWVLKCDIRKFFENIDHYILLSILKKYIGDQDIVWLLHRIIDSFCKTPGKGLPLGNLTSQLFVNIYMNEFDQFIKHKLKARFYIRYADDIAIMSDDRRWLEKIIHLIKEYLGSYLNLSVHPDKLFIKTLNSGVDFLGWVHFTDHKVLRTTTKIRMINKLKQPKNGAAESYKGMLKYGNTYKLIKEIEPMK